MAVVVGHGVHPQVSSQDGHQEDAVLRDIVILRRKINHKITKQDNKKDSNKNTKAKTQSQTKNTKQNKKQHKAKQETTQSQTRNNNWRALVPHQQDPYGHDGSCTGGDGGVHEDDVAVGDVLWQAQEVQLWLSRVLVGLDEDLADGGVLADR